MSTSRDTRPMVALVGSRSTLLSPYGPVRVLVLDGGVVRVLGSDGEATHEMAVAGLRVSTKGIRSLVLSGGDASVLVKVLNDATMVPSAVYDVFAAECEAREGRGTVEIRLTGAVGVTGFTLQPMHDMKDVRREIIAGLVQHGATAA